MHPEEKAISLFTCLVFLRGGGGVVLMNLLLVYYTLS